MNLEKYVAVSGMSGLFRLVANRSNGLVVADLDNGKGKFVSGRKHQFTPLASLGIYTETDTAELTEVFKTMLQQLETNPPVSQKSSVEEIMEYFGKILPEFDRERVSVNDIRKVIKWFNFLNERNLLSLDEEVENKEDASEETPIEEEKTKEV